MSSPRLDGVVKALCGKSREAAAETFDVLVPGLTEDEQEAVEDFAEAVTKLSYSSSTTSVTKSYTVEEISDAGAALVDQGKMAQLCDLLARTMFAPTELSISTVTAVFGAPVVLWILVKNQKGRERA